MKDKVLNQNRAGEEDKNYTQWIMIIMMSDFSSETVVVRKQWKNMLKTVQRMLWYSLSSPSRRDGIYLFSPWSCAGSVPAQPMEYGWSDTVPVLSLILKRTGSLCFLFPGIFAPPLNPAAMQWEVQANRELMRKHSSQQPSWATSQEHQHQAKQVRYLGLSHSFEHPNWCISGWLYMEKNHAKDPSEPMES